jgi:hypothetical protein
MYTDDWLSSAVIAAMTAAEERGYLRLLLYSWNEDDCGLPDDDDTLAQLSKLGATVDPSKITSKGYALYFTNARRWIDDGDRQPEPKPIKYFDVTTITGPKEPESPYVRYRG